jgi:hypothetical protein
MSARTWKRRLAERRQRMQNEMEAIAQKAQDDFEDITKTVRDIHSTVAEMRAAVDAMIGVGTEPLIVRPGIEKVRLVLPAWETCPTGTGRVMVRVR